MSNPNLHQERTNPRGGASYDPTGAIPSDQLDALASAISGVLATWWERRQEILAGQGDSDGDR